MQTESPYFKKILDTMYHSKVDEGQDFLRVMDTTINKCAHYPTNCEESISLHVIYLPSCPSWARELLVRFLIHRSTLSQDKDIISVAKRKTAGHLYLPMGMKGSSMQAKLLEEERNVLRICLLLDVEHPRFLHRASLISTFSANYYPVDAG